MKKVLYITLIACVFLLAAAIVQPTTHGIDYTQSADQFHEDHIEPTMDIEIGYYDPFVKGEQTARFKIRFGALTPAKAESEVSETGHSVTEFTTQTPNDYLLESDQISSVQQLEHWYDGRVTEKPVSTEGLNQQQSGQRYTGWFPSPEQTAELIAWSNGWTLTSIIDCQRSYEIEEGKKVIDAIYEVEAPAITTNTSFEALSNGESLTVTQNKAQLKAMGYDVGIDSTSKNSRDASTCLSIERIDTQTKIIPLLIILAIVIVGFFIVNDICNTIIATDATPYGIDDLAEKYEEGFYVGVNESHDNYRDRLKDLLINGDISNETYCLLTSELDANYDQTVAEFTNPYASLTSGGQNSWWNTVIVVITVVIVVTVIIIVLLIALYFLRKTKWGKKAKKEGGFMGWLLGLGAGKKKAKKE